MSYLYTPVSTGLYDIKHMQAMPGQTVWTYMQLINMVTKKDSHGNGIVLGGKPIKLEEIVGARRCVQRHLAALKTGGYILVTYTPYGMVIKVTKCKKDVPQKNTKSVNKSMEQDDTKSVNKSMHRYTISGAPLDKRCATSVAPSRCATSVAPLTISGAPNKIIKGDRQQTCDAPYGRDHGAADVFSETTDERDAENEQKKSFARSDTTRVSVPPEFVLALEIERLLNSPQKHLRLVGRFVQEKHDRYGMDVVDHERFRVVVDRQLKAAGKIVGTNVRRVDVMTAMDRAFVRCGDETTLDTVYKYLAK